MALLFNGIQRSRSKKVRVLGVQAQMSTFDYFYGLRLGILLLRHSVNLSASLQAKDLCAGEAQTIAKNTVTTLTKVRTYENYHLFWEDVKQEAAKLYIDAPKLPTRKKARTRMEEFLGGKAAPKYANDVISHFAEYILNPLIISLMLLKSDLTRKISEHTSTSKIFC